MSDPFRTPAPPHGFAPEPCGSCPYRRDVPVDTWDACEFERVLEHDRNEVGGSVFGCHKFRLRPKEADVCAGWFLDQQKRGYPSIRLRMLLMKCTEEPKVTDGGHPLYESIEEMCAANGVEP
jgi:hypothetical protein